MRSSQPLSVHARLGPDRRLRAGDEDRARIASRLADHYAKGRLDYAEFDERTSRALAAVHLDDLDDLLADLPEPPPAQRRGSRPGPPSPVRTQTRPVTRTPWRPLFLLLVLALVVVTRGAALWLLPLLWWVAGPRRLGRRSAAGATPSQLPASPGWRAGPGACHR